MQLTDELREKINIICERIADGESLRSILKDRKPFARSTFFEIVNENKDIQDQYARAMLERADYYAEKMLEVAETPQEGEEVTTTVQGTTVKTGDMLGHRKLIVDTYKWAAARMNPKKYGDKIDMTSGGEKINVISLGTGDRPDEAI
jgi:hypothetical protein